MFDGSFKSSRKVNLSGRRNVIARHDKKAAVVPPMDASNRVTTLHSGSKQGLLEFAKQSRNHRNELKVQEVMALKMQKIWRGVRIARNTRGQVMRQLKEQLYPYIHQSNSTAHFPPLPRKEMQNLMSRYMFCERFRSKTLSVSDSILRNAIEASLIGLLLAHCVNALQNNSHTMAKDSFLTASHYLLENKSIAGIVWLSETVFMLTISIRHAMENHSRHDITENDIASYSQAEVLMRILLSSNSYEAFEIPGKRIYDCILRAMSRKGKGGSLYSIVASCLLNLSSTPQQPSNDRLLDFISTIMAEILSFGYTHEGQDQSEESMLQVFACMLLAHPCAVQDKFVLHCVDKTVRLTGNSSNVSFWVTFVRAYANKKCSEKFVATQPQPESAWNRAVILGNLLDIAYHCKLDDLLLDEIFVIIRCIFTAEIAQWTFSAMQEAEEDLFRSLQTNEGSDEEEDTIEDGFSANKGESLQCVLRHFGSTLSSQKRHLEFAAGPNSIAVRRQCEQLGSKDFVRRVVETLLNQQQDSATYYRYTESISYVYSLILLVHNSRQVFSISTLSATPSQRVSTILNTLSFRFQSPATGQAISFVSTLLRALTLRIYGAPSLHSPGFGPVLLLLNIVFGHMLLALDDETFYRNEWPLASSDVVSLIELLRSFLYEVCWYADDQCFDKELLSALIRSRTSHESKIDVSSAEELLAFATISSSITLFNQLYDRASRRQSIPPNLWLWPRMPTLNEIVDLETMEGSLQRTSALFEIVRDKRGSLQKSDPKASHTIHRGRSELMSFILTTMPQVFSFADRVVLFQRLLDLEKQNLMHLRDVSTHGFQIRVRRDTIVEDSFAFFKEVEHNLSSAHFKARIKVTFINEQGLEEAGIDGGGVFKEYMDSLTRATFSPELGFFLVTEQDQLLYPNPAACVLTASARELWDRFRFMGRILGKALYENILVEPQFAAFFLNKLLGKYNYIDDLQSLDPVLYKSLMQLKNDPNLNFEDLALTFTVNDSAFGQVKTQELSPGGSEIPVTNENKIRYIHLLAHYKLNTTSARECNAFLRGFRDLIPARWIQMFSPTELQMVIGGCMTKKIDLEDWKRNTVYGGGYHPAQEIIKWYWEIVEEFSLDNQSALLKFITSVSRPPLLGFKQLDPQLCIQQVRVESDDRLPSSATCMNLLKLPAYSSKAIMRQKLLYSIKSNSGFDLS